MNENTQLLVFSGRASQNFSIEVTRSLGAELGRLEVSKFSDGELCVDISENVRGRDVFIIQSTSAPTNEHLMELLIVIDALKRSSAERITAVIPYYGYARQDRKLKARMPITAKLVADMITTAGANRVLTMDLHSGQIMGFFNSPVDNLSSLPVIYEYLAKNYNKEKLTIVSPDAGGVERARNLASRFPESQIAIIDKRRPGPNQIAEMRVVGEVKGRFCLVIDDMIDTGGTIVKAAETLMKEGASKVVACATHAVLSGSAVEKLQNSFFEEVIVTDTILIPEAKRFEKLKVLSVAPIVAEAIKRIHTNDSVSVLFQ